MDSAEGPGLSTACARRDVYELKQRLITVGQQTVIDEAIDQYRVRLKGCVGYVHVNICQNRLRFGKVIAKII